MPLPDARTITRISIVSHGQAELVRALLDDLATWERDSDIQVILTLNLPETLPFDTGAYPFPLHVVRNDRPQGFGANHNAAFHLTQPSAEFTYYCVLNPDIRLTGAVLPTLREILATHTEVGLVAPRVVNQEGIAENSARRLPTPLAILGKAIRLALRGKLPVEPPLAHPHWVAGMFMLFPVHAFSAVGGFDEAYHLYYEDVDLCCRLRLAGYDIHLAGDTSVIHDARRASHRSLRYMRWHLASMLRFFTSGVFFKCRLKLK